MLTTLYISNRRKRFGLVSLFYRRGISVLGTKEREALV